MEQVPLTDHLTKNAGNGGFAESNKIDKKTFFAEKIVSLNASCHFSVPRQKFRIGPLIFNFFNFFAAASINRFLVKKCSEAIRVGSF